MCECPCARVESERVTIRGERIQNESFALSEAEQNKAQTQQRPTNVDE
jgi:hypothetical protein